MKMRMARRDVLIGLSAGGGSLIANSASGAAEGDHCRRLAQKLTDAMAMRHGGRWRFTLDHEGGFVVISPEI